MIYTMLLSLISIYIILAVGSLSLHVIKCKGWERNLSIDIDVLNAVLWSVKFVNRIVIWLMIIIGIVYWVNRYG